MSNLQKNCIATEVSNPINNEWNGMESIQGIAGDSQLDRQVQLTVFDWSGPGWNATVCFNFWRTFKCEICPSLG